MLINDIMRAFVRADVKYYDDIEINKRIFLSCNKEKPLTHEEKEAIKRFYFLHGVPLELEFREVEN